MKALAIAPACLALAVAGCGDDDDSPIRAARRTTEQARIARRRARRSRRCGPEGPPPKELAARPEDGSGASESRRRVTVQYVGVNYESGEEFDASWDRGEPFTFQLGAGQVIPGWDQGVEG